MTAGRRTVRTTQSPIGETTLQVDGLGEVTGLLYANGVRQFLGIPYARLAKRWTRSTLADSWPDGKHDGRDLGSQAPNPPEFRCTGDLTPIDTFAHLSEPVEDEATCLVVNITIPPESAATSGPLPVMFYIHGGSLLFGGGNRSIFDCVNLVSRSMDIDRPVVTINMNYRVGFGGFLASKDIAEDMKKDGLSGVGNFGLTDQQTCLEWVQRYIPSFHGDRNNVMVYGLSAGGISIGHQLRARHPPVFHRAISMSGVERTVPAMSLEEHEKIYQKLLAHFSIDGEDPGALEKLRQIPETKVADATMSIITVGSPCDDGVFHQDSTMDHPFAPPPKWLKSYMVGDVKDEAKIFLYPLGKGKDYQWFKNAFVQFMSPTDAEMVLSQYDLKPDADHETCTKFLHTIFGDCTFGIPQWRNARESDLTETYAYHFDLPSHISTSFPGVSFHALDLQYVFLNMHDELGEKDLAFAKVVSEKYIRFAYGEAPWEPYHPNRTWGIFTDKYMIETRTEVEDDRVRHYSRWNAIEKQGLLDSFMLAARYIRRNYT